MLVSFNSQCVWPLLDIFHLKACSLALENFYLFLYLTCFGSLLFHSGIFISQIQGVGPAGLYFHISILRPGFLMVICGGLYPYTWDFIYFGNHVLLLRVLASSFTPWSSPLFKQRLDVWTVLLSALSLSIEATLPFPCLLLLFCIRVFSLIPASIWLWFMFVNKAWGLHLQH